MYITKSAPAVHEVRKGGGGHVGVFVRILNDYKINIVCVLGNLSVR